MTTTADIEALLATFVEHHVVHGERLDVRELCAARPDLLAPLQALVDRYLSISATLDGECPGGVGGPPAATPLPSFDGFQTIERIGAGGMGEVYKLRDLRLDRVVAAKVIRAERRGLAHVEGFLAEARALALFSDRRIVQVFDVRPASDPPVIIMEFVDGFELGRLGPSLEVAQRARVMAEVCDAIEHAHALGLQHRDLKPSNIMLDARLSPRILDFGLSASDPGHGHLKGTLPYVAPEQLDPSRAIDERTDVYALGVILYELLCGRAPYSGTDGEIIAQIVDGHPRLPVEIDASVPEAVQAIALTAMERDPALRYQSAQEMAADLRRYLSGRPVLARPSIYLQTLGARVRPHLDQIGEWLRLRLIYPHEADRLHAAYRTLDAREDDWIVGSRALSYSRIALYLGAFLLLCGSLFYFFAARVYEQVDGLAGPVVVLGLPFVGLNAAAHLLYRRDRKAVAVAFYLAAVTLLPLFLLILFDETGFLGAVPGTPGQLFDTDVVSNRQLQVTTFVASAWCGLLAFRTRTVALSTVFNVLALLLALAALADVGLRAWLEEGRWDRLALHLFPLAFAYGVMGAVSERAGHAWMAQPAYLGGALLLVVLLEMLALHGRAFEHLGGLTLNALQPGNVSDPALLDTIAAMTINGAIFYAVGALLHRQPSEAVRPAAHLLLGVAPFALLHPLGYLVRTTEYSPRFDWVYLAFALGVVLLSHRRQRRSFYYAGLLNVGLALYWIAARREWFEWPAWAVAIVAAGLAALAAGFALDCRERTRR
ncbi:MAG TPA: serine/threonine-protein kinase [Vicinamibacterales bacterium]|nr:serine/threonine-protein kinase [Vicinamibacterales bacterium]